MPTFRPGAGPGDLVFTSSKGMPRRRSFAARVFKPGAAGRARPGADVPGLRKVATGYMVDDKIHPRVIQHRLGHATARLSQEMYAKVSDAANHDGASLWGHGFRLLRARSGHEPRKATDPAPTTRGKNTR